MIILSEAEYQPDHGSIKDNPYLALTGELWGVFCEYVWENWLRYNGTALYFQYPSRDGETPLICARLSQRLMYCVEKRDQGMLYNLRSYNTAR